MTLIGGVYRAEGPLAIALAGAPMSALIREPSGAERSLRAPQSASLRPGEELVLGGSPSGTRCYLAVRGGWETPIVLGSRSSESRVRAGDILLADRGSILTRRPVAWPWAPSNSAGPIRVVDGPDADPCSGVAALLEAGAYQVTDRSDRMGLGLDGPPIDLEAAANRPSAPVAPGAVQIANHRPIVLGVAGGTMGGYLHLAHVISADLDRLGPAPAGRSGPISEDRGRRSPADRSPRSARTREVAKLDPEKPGRCRLTSVVDSHVCSP